MSPFCALSLALLASAPPATKRVGVVLVAMDRASEAQVVKLESYLTEAMEQYPRFSVRKTEDLLGMPGDEQAEAALKRAEAGYKEGRAAFDAKQWEDAERRLRADIKEFQKAATALKTCGHLCDALAMYAAVLQMRGDTEEAKLQLLDVLALQPSFEFDVKRFGRDVVALKMQVSTGHGAALRGSAQVKTKPAGARVYLDGEFAGFSPLPLTALAVGKHLLRFERPGFKVQGQLLDITPEEEQVQVDLKATPGYKAYDASLGKVGQEVPRDNGGAAITGLGKSLGLDRALVGTLKELADNGATEVVIGYYDLKTGKKLYGKRVLYQGDEYGQIKQELGHLVSGLVAGAEGGGDHAGHSSDPLENRHGTEEWNSESSTRSTKRRPGNGDPLDGRSGTEDW